jgi:glycosyl transferase family 25
MKNLIEHFDRTYIINLAERTDRRQEVTREFGKLGIQIPNERIRFYTAQRPPDRGDFKDIGTRGNFLSHRGVLELARNEGLRNVLVLEDDVTFREVPERFVRSLIAHLSEIAWDVVYFGYLIPSDDSLEGPLHPWPKDVLGAHFYAVNGPFINTMRKYMHECELRPRDHPDGGPMTADGAYNHVRYVIEGIRVFLAVPNLAHQRNSRTDIHDTHFLDKVFWLRPLVRCARTIKHRVRMTIDRKKLRSRFD